MNFLLYFRMLLLYLGFFLLQCVFSAGTNLNNETSPPTIFHKHVPARFVPIPAVDPALKRDFLELFHVPPGFSSWGSATLYQSRSLISSRMVKEINELVPPNAFFYSFATRHLEAKDKLEQVFHEQSTPRDVYNVAKNLLERGEVNKKVWFFALLGALISRTDLNGYQIAASLDATPDLYITASAIHSALNGQRLGRNYNKNCAVFTGSGGSTEYENKLWYFREDIMVNQHHWYWHQYFPSELVRRVDRRGEMFYYMHHNILARYNAERLSNGMSLTNSLDVRLGANIGAGYDADLIDMQSGLFWTPRRNDAPMVNINHVDDIDFEMDIYPQEVDQLLTTFIQHIRGGYLKVKNDTFPDFKMNITAFDAIDHLGNAVEANGVLSVHPDVYDFFGFHNLGHIMVSLVTDPDFSKGFPAGVMADSPNAMRDPVFYRMHSLIDYIFFAYKSTLPPYQLHEGDFPLVWEGVTIQKLEILNDAERRANLINTFWSIHSFPLEEGIDGSIHNGDANVNVCQVHLEHQPFVFRLIVDVSDKMTSKSGKGTVRIFMAPRYDLNGRRFTMVETSQGMFQLDSFPVELEKGRNIITRNSLDSSTTKPWSRSLEQMLQDPFNDGKAEYCGCGWPSHLFVPKGTEPGMLFDLFAMITNFDEDFVEDTPEDLNIPEPCHSPHVFCGIPHRRFPDSRPMGYPFDRLPYSIKDKPVDNLSEYVKHVPNMAYAVVTIQHANVLIK